MKTCPACQTQYTDDALQFCLQDGSQLMASRGMDTPAVLKDLPAWQSQVTQIAAQKKGPKTGLIVAVTALVMLVIFGAVGIGAFLYFRNNQTGSANNISVKANVAGPVSNSNTRLSSTPQNFISPTPAPSRDANRSMPEDGVDEGRVKNEVTQTLISWKSSTESLDLDENLAHYADRLDYYKRSGVNRAFIRADKQRAFAHYDSINLKLTNISISVEPGGQVASVRFDKEWDFDGDERSSGKVQQFLKMKKFDGEWLITAEKDLKVYFTRKNNVTK